MKKCFLTPCSCFLTPFRRWGSLLFSRNLEECSRLSVLKKRTILLVISFFCKSWLIFSNLKFTDIELCRSFFLEILKKLQNILFVEQLRTVDSESCILNYCIRNLFWVYAKAVFTLGYLRITASVMKNLFCWIQDCQKKGNLSKFKNKFNKHWNFRLIEK